MDLELVVGLRVESRGASLAAQAVLGCVLLSLSLVSTSHIRAANLEMGVPALSQLYLKAPSNLPA